MGNTPNTLSVFLDPDHDGKDFDSVVHHKDALPDFGDLKIITKDKGTVGGRPIAVLTFTVAMPDGTQRIAQTVTTVRLLKTALGAIAGRYRDV